MARYLVGVDVGGTFTDILAFDTDTRRILIGKTPTTPPGYVQGVMNALAKVTLTPDSVRLLNHGTTVTSNAVVERNGPRTALVTTAGFRDVLETARADREEMFNLAWSPPAMLVKRRDIVTVNERVDYRGRVLDALQDGEVENLARILRRRGVEAVAVCFINSPVNPAHERRVAEILRRELPGVAVCASTDVCPEILEYERTSTTVINAYLTPVVDQYFANLDAALRSWGSRGGLLIAVMSGGVMSVNRARSLPAALCEAGPAMGVIGAAHWAGLAGYQNLISFDMGGTTTKFAVVRDGRPRVVHELFLEFNKPIKYPSVPVRSIGAGGGSIAWVDDTGALEVGPRSASAAPGPACYGLGGEDPTITDAHVVLRRISPSASLAGELRVDEKLARKAVEKIAVRLGVTAEDCAVGILEVATAKMVGEGRVICVREGLDPRDFVLLGFGGAGPMHAVEFARALGIPKVVIPPHPGLLSALGSLLVDYRHDFSFPVLRRLGQLSQADLDNAYAHLESEAVESLQKEGFDPQEITIERFIDIRYFRKAKYLSFAIKSGDSLSEIVTEFYRRCEVEYGYVMPSHIELEIINARVSAYGKVEKPPFEPVDGTRAGGGKAEPKERRETFFYEGGRVTAAVYDRAALQPGDTLAGPAIVEQTDSTVVIPPGARARVDGYLNLIIE